MTKNDFITAFIAEGKGNLTEAARAWDKSEFKGTRKEAGSPSAYYAYLREADRTIAEAEAYLKEEGSENMYRSRSFYLAVAKLVSEVREDERAAKAPVRKAS